MGEGFWVALVGGGLTLGGVIATVWGSRFVAKVSAKSQAKTAEIEEDKVRAAAYTEARTTYREMVSDLRKEIAGVRAAQAEDRKSHQEQLADQEERHRTQISELREERRERDTLLNQRIDELEARDEASRKRIEALESQRDTDQRRINALDLYIRQLIRVLRDNQIVPPPAPPGMSFD